MLSCHQATKLLSESQERSLSVTEKMGLKFHTAMCSGCRNFGSSVDTFREAMKGFASGEYEEKELEQEQDNNKTDNN